MEESSAESRRATIRVAVEALVRFKRDAFRAGGALCGSGT